MKVVVDIADIDGLLSKDSRIGIYRVVQEALTNIGKHAQAKKASVKENADTELFSAIEKIRGGRMYFSPSLSL
ncbi:MAG: hypothetical protein M1497_03390, partial [Nitrospirae bacterium]|nr:hypothetical protein [Nitrospirota bacterium]